MNPISIEPSQQLEACRCDSLSTTLFLITPKPSDAKKARNTPATSGPKSFKDTEIADSIRLTQGWIAGNTLGNRHLEWRFAHLQERGIEGGIG